MKNALIRLVSSMKTWTLILGLTATFLAKYGVHVDDSTAQMIASGFALLLGAQAITDHGKAAALIHAQAMRGPANANAPAQEAPKVAQAGYAKLGALAFMVALGSVVVVAACPKGKQDVAGAVNAGIDCAKVDVGQLVGDQTLLATVAIDLAQGDYGALIDALIAKLGTVGGDAVACAVKYVETVAISGQGSGSASTSSQTPTADHAQDVISKHGWKFSGAAK